VNEVRLLASINSPFVISYKESFFDDEDKSLYIVMEYADKGDLMKAIESKKRNRDKFTET
jgi:NIMA (never in mitosis gene a)-related kinase 1/4/5